MLPADRARLRSEAVIGLDDSAEARPLSGALAVV
jgi:hypothetical protein